MKFLFLVADGMGDWPLSELGHRTPLEAADTPAMDELARTGIVGRCATIPKSMPPGSDVANMALLGFDPETYHTGRGPIEAAAQNLEAGPDDLIWRMNLVTVEDYGPDGIMRDYSAGHIETEQSRPLVERMQEVVGNETYQFVPGIQYRHLLVQRGGALTPEADLEIRPPHDILDKPINKDMQRYSRNPEFWDVLQEAREILVKNGTTRANAVWPWGQGRRLSLPDFEKTFGMKGAVISAVDLIKGLGFASGMEVIDVPGATGLLDTNYEGKVEAALKFLETGDFVFVHLEGPDECGHGGDPEEKREAIERFDKRVVTPLREALKDEETAWLICCDHYTPCVERTHTKDAVPFIVNAPGCEASGLEHFTEKTADSTGVRVEEGFRLLPYALEHARKK